MKKREWGGIKIKEKKIYTLAYVVLLTEEEKGMSVIIYRLERDI